MVQNIGLYKLHGVTVVFMLKSDLPESVFQQEQPAA